MDPAAYWLLVRDITPDLVIHGRSLFQAVVRNPFSGKIWVARMFYRVVGARYLHTVFQDVSHLYPELLE